MFVSFVHIRILQPMFGKCTIDRCIIPRWNFVYNKNIHFVKYIEVRLFVTVDH